MLNFVGLSTYKKIFLSTMWSQRIQSEIELIPKVNGPKEDSFWVCSGYYKRLFYDDETNINVA